MPSTAGSEVLDVCSLPSNWMLQAHARFSSAIITGSVELLPFSLKGAGGLNMNTSKYHFRTKVKIKRAELQMSSNANFLTLLIEIA